jgi:hypothetical protein
LALAERYVGICYSIFITDRNSCISSFFQTNSLLQFVKLFYSYIVCHFCTQLCACIAGHALPQVIHHIQSENVWLGIGARGGHRHWQVGRMPDTDLKPDLRSKGVKDRTFLTNRRQKLCPLQRSLSITMSRDRLLHFQCKKTSCLLPLPSQRSKVVSINIPIPFFKI